MLHAFKVLIKKMQEPQNSTLIILSLNFKIQIYIYTVYNSERHNFTLSLIQVYLKACFI